MKMDDRTKELLKKEMWTWIGCIYCVVSLIIRKSWENFTSLDTSISPKPINEWLIQHGYMVIKVSDLGHNILYSFISDIGCLFVGYYICCIAIKKGGVTYFKCFMRGAFIWGVLVFIIVYAWLF